jgi:divalent metal cation (Fe/Co/Zn/Cd) transporter
VRSLLVGRSADPLIQGAIDRVIAEDDHIEKVFNTITMQFGPDTLLAAKIKLKSGIDIDTAIADINRLERNLKAEIPNLKWSFMEPDVDD